MIGAGSLAHNRRDFVAENVNPDRVQLNICYKNENLKEVYKELFDDAVERYNVGKKKYWQKSQSNMELNGNRKVHMKSIWMFTISRRKSVRRKCRNWNRKRNI